MNQARILFTEKTSSDVHSNELINDYTIVGQLDFPQNYHELKRIGNDNKLGLQVLQARDVKDIFINEASTKELVDINIQFLTDKEKFSIHNLEEVLGDEERAVVVRRKMIECLVENQGVLKSLPFENFNYKLVQGNCCENVIGYVPIPVGVVGPLLLNNQEYFVPLATTEGCLVASANRGCRAILNSGGVKSDVYSDGMTRGPVIHFPSAMRATKAMKWLENETNYSKIKKTFDSTSRFAKLQRIHCRIAGRYLYIRFISSTGDAMGMNMLSKGTEAALKELSNVFTDVQTICLSGNFCTDKKAAAVNWIEGRGKSVVCEALIPKDVVKNVLKTNVEALVELNISKNLIGSAVAGTIGGNNAHAANIVAALFIACGQDPAQTVVSSNCITLMEAQGNDLLVSCTMPSIEVGTVGGGTILEAQSACLELIGVKGTSPNENESNSCKLATIVCATVLAAELSLLSALATNQLVKSHMKLNRAKVSD